MFLDERRAGEPQQAQKPQPQAQLQPENRGHHVCGPDCCPTKGYGLRKTLRGWW